MKSTVESLPRRPRYSPYWSRHVLGIVADSLWLASSKSERLSPIQREMADELASRIGKTPPRIVQPIEDTSDAVRYMRVYGPAAWDRAARNVHCGALLREAGLLTPPCLASGFVKTRLGYHFAIVEGTQPDVKNMWQAHSDIVAVGIADDMARCRRIAMPLHLRPLFRTMAWRRPRKFIEDNARRLGNRYPVEAQVLVDDSVEAPRFDYSRHPTLGQTDMHGNNICVSPGGRPVWFDRDEFRIYPLELQIANVMLTCLHGVTDRVDPFIAAVCQGTGISVSEWRRFRLLHLRTMAAVKFLTSWLNAPYLGRTDTHVGFYATRYMATHDVAEREQTDTELMGEIVEHWRRRRSRFHA